MSVTLDGIADRLDRMERALSEGAVERVRTLSLDQVERLTGLPRKAILAAIRSGDLASIEIGARTRVVRPEALDEWLAWVEARS